MSFMLIKLESGGVRHLSPRRLCRPSTRKLIRSVKNTFRDKDFSSGLHDTTEPERGERTREVDIGITSK